MKTAEELSKLIGQEVSWRAGNGLMVRVKIVDVREVWGRTDVKIVPVAGDGEAWVEVSKVNLGKVI